MAYKKFKVEKRVNQNDFDNFYKKGFGNHTSQRRHKFFYKDGTTVVISKLKKRSHKEIIVTFNTKYRLWVLTLIVLSVLFPPLMVIVILFQRYLAKIFMEDVQEQLQNYCRKNKLTLREA